MGPSIKWSSIIQFLTRSHPFPKALDMRWLAQNPPRIAPYKFWTKPLCALVSPSVKEVQRGVFVETWQRKPEPSMKGAVVVDTYTSGCHTPAFPQSLVFLKQKSSKRSKPIKCQFVASLKSITALRKLMCQGSHSSEFFSMAFVILSELVYLFGLEEPPN